MKRILEPQINPKPDLSRKKSLKASGNLLVGFSGGLGSTTLLDLISRIYLSNRMEIKEEGIAKPRGGKGHPRNEPVWKKVTVCYVEIAAGFPGVSYSFLSSSSSSQFPTDDRPHGNNPAISSREI